MTTDTDTDTDIDNDTDTDTDTPAESERDPLPDGMVYRGTGGKVFHTDGTCDRITTRKHKMRKPVAESWDTIRECSICSDETQNRGSGSASTVCEGCGHAAARLVPHRDAYLCDECLSRVMPQAAVDTLRSYR
jgi:hypothetical protein